MDNPENSGEKKKGGLPPKEPGTSNSFRLEFVMTFVQEQALKRLHKRSTIGRKVSLSEFVRSKVFATEKQSVTELTIEKLIGIQYELREIATLLAQPCPPDPSQCPDCLAQSTAISTQLTEVTEQISQLLYGPLSKAASGKPLVG